MMKARKKGGAKSKMTEEESGICGENQTSVELYKSALGM